MKYPTKYVSIFFGQYSFSAWKMQLYNCNCIIIISLIWIPNHKEHTSSSSVNLEDAKIIYIPQTCGEWWLFTFPSYITLLHI